jgi:hypothetical protein
MFFLFFFLLSYICRNQLYMRLLIYDYKCHQGYTEVSICFQFAFDSCNNTVVVLMEEKICTRERQGGGSRGSSKGEGEGEGEGEEQDKERFPLAHTSYILSYLLPKLSILGFFILSLPFNLASKRSACCPLHSTRPYCQNTACCSSSWPRASTHSPAYSHTSHSRQYSAPAYV